MGGEYNFAYLPIHFGSECNFGYAFINLTSPAVAQRFRTHFKGFEAWPQGSRVPESDAKLKAAEVFWSHPHQGTEMHIERYRNSPLMHKDVPDRHKPVLFREGKRIDFPPPTRKLKEPRVRSSRKKSASII